MSKICTGCDEKGIIKKSPAWVKKLARSDDPPAEYLGFAPQSHGGFITATLRIQIFSISAFHNTHYNLVKQGVKNPEEV